MHNSVLLKSCLDFLSAYTKIIFNCGRLLVISEVDVTFVIFIHTVYMVFTALEFMILHDTGMLMCYIHCANFRIIPKTLKTSTKIEYLCC